MNDVVSVSARVIASAVRRMLSHSALTRSFSYPVHDMFSYFLLPQFMHEFTVFDVRI